MSSKKKMDVIRETNNHLWCFCPHHDDNNNPNLSIDKALKTKGRMRCWACGWTGQIDPEKVDKMSSKKKSMCRPKKPVDWKRLYKDSLEYPGCMDEIANLSIEWGVETESLLSMGMGWSHEYQAYTGLMYDENWDVIGIQLRSKNGSKWCIKGSNLGLILPNYNEGNIAYQLRYPTVICEGRSDSVIAHDLGYFPIGRPSAMFGFELVSAYMKNQNLSSATIVADSDKIGKRSADLLALHLRKNDINCKVLNLYDVDDLRDMYNLKGKKACQKVLSL